MTLYFLLVPPMQLQGGGVGSWARNVAVSLQAPKCALGGYCSLWLSIWGTLSLCGDEAEGESFLFYTTERVTEL